MLKKDRALEIFAAVQTGAQNKMAIEQGAGFAKKGEKIFTHAIVGRVCETPFGHRASLAMLAGSVVSGVSA
jgi:hypothetical protein